MPHAAKQRELYRYPQETWSPAECRRLRKKTGRDGQGTPHPYRGEVQSSGAAVVYYGTQLYNGGTIIEGKWYRGYLRPWPKLPKGWKFLAIPTWGVHIAREHETAEDLATFR